MATQASAIGRRVVSSEAIRAFADLTGDHSRIHLDGEFARASGFAGPIAHGLLTGAWALGALAQHAPTRLGVGEPNALVGGYTLRLSQVVVCGDELVFRFADGALSDAARNPRAQVTSFEVVNQRDEIAASGEVTLRRDGAEYLREQSPLRIVSLPEQRGPNPDGPQVYFAEDMVESGPRGTAPLRVVSEAILCNDTLFKYVEQIGERNPLYSDETFAAASCCKTKVVPPMLIFCLGFSEFLHELQSVEMPAAGSAGHIADEWQMHRPASPGEQLRVVHQPVGSISTKSRPELAVVSFGLQIIDSNCELVQSGVVKMMIPTRPGA